MVSCSDHETGPLRGFASVEACPPLRRGSHLVRRAGVLAPILSPLPVPGRPEIPCARCGRRNVRIPLAEPYDRAVPRWCGRVRGDSSEREALPLLAEMSGRPSSRPPGALLMPGGGSGSRAPVRTSEPSCFGASIPFDSPGDSGSSASSPALLSVRHWCPAPTPEWRVGRTSRGRSYSAPSDFAPAVRVSRASARVAHDE